MAESPPPPQDPAHVFDPAMQARANAFKSMIKPEIVTRPGFGYWIALLIALNILIYGLGVASTIWWFPITRPGIAGLAVTDFAVGTLTFGMVLGWTKEMRTALAGSFFLMYLAFLGNILISDFYKQLNTDLGRNLLNILTASMTAIVTFYFAAKTTEQAFVVWQAGLTARRM